VDQNAESIEEGESGRVKAKLQALEERNEGRGGSQPKQGRFVADFGLGPAGGGGSEHRELVIGR